MLFFNNDTLVLKEGLYLTLFYALSNVLWFVMGFLTGNWALYQFLALGSAVVLFLVIFYFKTRSVPTLVHEVFGLSLKGFYFLLLISLAIGIFLLLINGSNYNPNITSFEDLKHPPLTIIQAPVFEELLFRGVLLFVFKQMMSESKAITLQAFMYSLWHLYVFAVFPDFRNDLFLLGLTFLLGIVLGFIRIQIKKNSMLVCIFLHLLAIVINISLIHLYT